MLRWLMVALLLVSFEAPAHAFWGALVKGLSKVGGAAKAGKAATGAAKAGKAAGAAKATAAGATAGALTDDVARGAGRAGGLGDDAVRAADDLPSGSGAAAEAESGPSMGESAIDVASNLVPTEGDEDVEDDDEFEDAGEGEALVGQLAAGVAVLGLVIYALRKRRRR